MIDVLTATYVDSCTVGHLGTHLFQIAGENVFCLKLDLEHLVFKIIIIIIIEFR